jgi:hypothetical protein
MLFCLLLWCLVQDVLDALPLAGAFWLTLLIHEAGHRQVVRLHVLAGSDLSALLNHPLMNNTALQTPCM